MNRLAKPFVGAVLLSCAICSGISLAQERSESRRWALKGATVLDGSGGPALPEAVIVIEGDRIQSVGAKGAAYPADATVLDLPGKFVIPGLIDSHTHYEEWMGEVFLNHGVTSAMGVNKNFGKKMRDHSQQSQVRSPRIYDTAGTPNLSPSMTEEQVRNTIREWLKTDPDFARLRDFAEGSEGMYQWATEEIHRNGLLVFGHTANAPVSVRAGQDVVEHVWGFVLAQMSSQERDEFQRGRHWHWAPFIRDWNRLDAMIQEAVERGAYLNPTLVYELGSLSPLAAKHEMDDYRLYSDPLLMAYYPRNISESLLQKHRQIRNFSGKYENLVLISRLTPAEAQEFRRGYPLVLEFIKRWVLAGGKIQAGTDSISGGSPGLSLHHEMELLVEAGLTPMQALQAATLWSAEILGKNGPKNSPKIGVIAPGTLADLVVLSADPSKDITNTRKIERVLKGGRWIELGYTPDYFSFTRPSRSIDMPTPVPLLSAIAPHTVLEGSPEFEMVLEGVGFVGNSVVRVDGISVPTTFLDPRKLKVRVPASAVERATPNDFDAPGPEQKTGVFGDRTVPITVYNAPPEGGTSNTIVLRIKPKWMAEGSR